MRLIDAMLCKDLINLKELEKRVEANQIKLAELKGLTEVKVELDDDAQDHLRKLLDTKQPLYRCVNNLEPEVELVNVPDNTLVPLVCKCCGEEQDWQSTFCPDCGKRVKTDEEIEYEKGVEIRKDMPECLCINDTCSYNVNGTCKNPPKNGICHEILKNISNASKR